MQNRVTHFKHFKAKQIGFPWKFILRFRFSFFSTWIVTLLCAFTIQRRYVRGIWVKRVIWCVQFAHRRQTQSTPSNRQWQWHTEATEKILRGENEKKTKPRSTLSLRIILFTLYFVPHRLKASIQFAPIFLLFFIFVRLSNAVHSHSVALVKSYDVSFQRTFSVECVFRSASVISMDTFQRHHFTQPKNEAR